MKATFNKADWSLEFDNDAIKAIRFVNGFNTDLRIRLTQKDLFWYWLDKNLRNICPEAADNAPGAEDVNWKLYERMLNKASEQICG